MAAHAVPVREPLMDLHFLNVGFLVALEAYLGARFNKQCRSIRSVRAVAIEAVAVGRGIMLKLRRLEEIVVALETRGDQRLF